MRVVSYYFEKKSVVRTLKKFRISKASLFAWIKEMKRIESFDGKQITYNAYRRTRDNLEQLRLFETLRKEGNCYPNDSIDEKMRAVDKLSKNGKYKVGTICKAVGLAKGTYYNRKNRGVEHTQKEMNDMIVEKAFIEAYKETKGRIGSGKMVIYLHGKGIYTSQRKILEISKKLDMPVQRNRPVYTPRNRSEHSKEETENLLHRRFNQAKPNMFWASDFSEFKVKGKKVYLCIIMDLYARRIIGWSVDTSYPQEMIINLFEETYKKRNKPELIGFHSDRGCQYTSTEFKSLLEKYEVMQSFSKRGEPYDNAVVESFFCQLKKEQYNGRVFSSVEELTKAIDEYMYFYNNIRPHISLSGLTPSKMEEEYYLKNK